MLPCVAPPSSSYPILPPGAVAPHSSSSPGTLPRCAVDAPFSSSFEMPPQNAVAPLSTGLEKERGATAGGPGM